MHVRRGEADRGGSVVSGAPDLPADLDAWLDVREAAVDETRELEALHDNPEGGS